MVDDKQNKKEKLSDEKLDKLSGGTYYKKGGIWKPYRVFNEKTYESRDCWTQKAAKKLDKEWNGDIEFLDKSNQWDAEDIDRYEKNSKWIKDNTFDYD